MDKSKLTVLALMTLTSSVIHAVPVPEYRIMELDEIYAQTDIAVRPVNATSINDHGRITGTYLPLDGDRMTPFVWDQKTGFTALRLPAGHTGSSAEHIHNNGNVVGFVSHPTFGTQAYLWRSNSGVNRRLQLFPQLQDRLPMASNERYMVGGYDPAWVYDMKGDRLFELVIDNQVYPGVNKAIDINDSNVVVGTITAPIQSSDLNPPVTLQGFRWTPPSLQQPNPSLELLPMPNADWFMTEAVAINDQGDITGTVFDLEDDSVARWDGETGLFADLGIVPGELVSEAKAINSKGMIAGWSPNDHPDGLDTPFVWINGQFFNLASPSSLMSGGGFLYRAYDINDDGVILAEIFDPSAAVRFRFVLLLPVNP